MSESEYERKDGYVRQFISSDGSPHYRNGVPDDVHIFLDLSKGNSAKTIRTLMSRLLHELTSEIMESIGEARVIADVDDDDYAVDLIESRVREIATSRHPKLVLMIEAPYSRGIRMNGDPT